MHGQYEDQINEVTIDERNDMIVVPHTVLVTFSVTRSYFGDFYSIIVDGEETPMDYADWQHEKQLACDLVTKRQATTQDFHTFRVIADALLWPQSHNLSYSDADILATDECRYLATLPGYAI